MMEKNTLDKPVNKIRKIIGVMSGKGGVGKSTVSYLIASALKLKGYTVGILDSDITGPSIPRLFNLKKGGIQAEGNYLIPFETQQGIKVVSMNLLLENDEQPVIWRGPLLSKAVQQFWEDVAWGELDFLIVDMPPGTADVALTVMQAIPINGLIVATTPHEMVAMIVSKSINMAKAMKIPVWGLIENMSYLICPECGKKIDFFENTVNSGSKNGVEILAKIPMMREISAISTKGLPVQNEKVAAILEEIAEAVLKKSAL
jgi:Mrp family chromosome partitioning ATPase